MPGGNGITPEENVRIVVRPLASALPLGFFSFGIGMLLLGGLANGWLRPGDQHTVGLLLAAAAVLGKPLISFIMSLAALRIAFSGVHEFGGPPALWTAAGWLGVAVFAFAVYGGLAFLLEDVLQQEVLPVFRVGASRHSVEGNLHEQLRGIGREAGVRHTL